MPDFSKTLLTFLRLMPDDSLQIDAGPRLTGPQTGWVPLQGPWDTSILGVGANGPRPHRQLLRVWGGQGWRGEGRGRRQRGAGGPGVAWSRGSWHREHGVHLRRRGEDSKRKSEKEKLPRSLICNFTSLNFRSSSVQLSFIMFNEI